VSRGSRCVGCHRRHPGAAADIGQIVNSEVQNGSLEGTVHSTETGTRGGRRSPEARRRPRVVWSVSETSGRNSFQDLVALQMQRRPGSAASSMRARNRQRLGAGPWLLVAAYYPRYPGTCADNAQK